MNSAQRSKSFRSAHKTSQFDLSTFPLDTMTQSKEPSAAAAVLLSVLFSLLSSALFSFSGMYYDDAAMYYDDAATDGYQEYGGTDQGRPYRVRFDAPDPASDGGFRASSISDAGVDEEDAGDGRRRRLENGAGTMYACGGRSGIARIVPSPSDCVEKETVYAWGPGGSDGAACEVSKEGGVANVTCGADFFVAVPDGADGAQGPAGTGCGVAKNEEGVAVLTCGEDSVNIVDGAAGRDGVGCTVFEAHGGAILSCGEDYTEIPYGEAGPAGAGCTVSKDGDVATVACGDEPVHILDGTNGSQGSPGAPGADADCSVSQTDGIATISCSEELPVRLADGNEGPAGKDCSVTKSGNVATIDCGGEVVEISDGEDGKPAGGDGDINDRIVTLDAVAATYSDDRFRGTDAAGSGKPVENIQPSLGVNFMIRYQAGAPASSQTLREEESTEAPKKTHHHHRLLAQDAMVGEIRMFSGPVAPEGWLICDGSKLYKRNIDYWPLYDVIGNMYNGEDVGPLYFALPDLRGRVPVSTGRVQLAPGSAQVVGLGKRYGSAGVALTKDNLPNHQHMVAEVQSITGTASVVASA